MTNLAFVLNGVLCMDVKWISVKLFGNTPHISEKINVLINLDQLLLQLSGTTFLSLLPVPSYTHWTLVIKYIHGLSFSLQWDLPNTHNYSRVSSCTSMCLTSRYGFTPKLQSHHQHGHLSTNVKPHIYTEDTKADCFKKQMHNWFLY